MMVMSEHDYVPSLNALLDRRGEPRAGRAGLWLSREGRWYFDGQPVVHERLSALLDRSMVRRDDGLVVTTGIDTLPFASEDAPLRVVAWDLGQGLLTYHSGLTEAVPPVITIDALGIVRSASANGLWARWERRVAHQLATQVNEEGSLSLSGAVVVLIAADLATDWTAAPRGA
jgi:hypothetical protein